MWICILFCVHVRNKILKRVQWSYVKRLIYKVERVCSWRAAFQCPQHPVHYGYKKRRQPPTTFSSFIKQRSYTFIIVQILSFIWNLDWLVTSKGPYALGPSPLKFLLCWLPLVSILHQEEIHAMFKQPLGVQPGHSIVWRYYIELVSALIKSSPAMQVQIRQSAFCKH